MQDSLAKKCVSLYIIKCLPSHIIKWIVVSFLLEEHNRNNRLCLDLPVKQLEPGLPERPLKGK